MEAQLLSLGQQLAEDTHNLVADYCADGLEAFYSCVSAGLASSSGTSAEASARTAEVLSSVREGTQRLNSDTSSRIGSSLGLFEQLCAASIFKPPVVAASIPQLAPVSLPDDGGCSSSSLGDLGTAAAGGAEGGGEEAQLAARTAGMRRELAKVDERCARLRQEIQRVDRHVANSGDASDYRVLAATAASNRQAVQAVVAAALQLQAMMERAAHTRSAAGAAAAGGQGLLLGGNNGGADKVLQAQSSSAGNVAAASNAALSTFEKFGEALKSN